jgi:stalled ribosome rescue protein Dom34
MKGKAGVWIDRRKALIIVVTPAGSHSSVVLSQVEKHLKRTGDSPLKGRYEPQQVPADDRRQRALTGRLNTYYDAVIAALQKIGVLVVFGPGEAKAELTKRLAKQRPDLRLAAVSTADKMSDRQFAAKVRNYYKAKERPTEPTYGRPTLRQVSRVTRL